MGNYAFRLPQNNSAKDSQQPGDTRTATTTTGQSKRIRLLRDQIAKLARSQAPIFISGESGSGKELAARAIHNQSSRSDSPFVAVNCGAIPKELMEREFFGHLKGSFSGADKDKQGLFQAAQSGTLFLDEVADLPLQMQVKLLRVIQEKSVRPIGSQKEQAVDVRLLSATHKNLAKEVELGNLRQDLYFRINVIELGVPSLRDRIEDIEELTINILEKIARENEAPLCVLSPDALVALKKYNFPGNVRELENILQRAATLCEDNTIQASNLEFISAPVSKSVKISEEAPVTTADSEVTITDDFSLEKHLEAIEIQTIEKALQETRGNKTAAAKKLGMSFRALRYRRKKRGLEKTRPDLARRHSGCGEIGFRIENWPSPQQIIRQQPCRSRRQYQAVSELTGIDIQIAVRGNNTDERHTLRRTRS